MYLKKATKNDLETFYTISLQKHIGKNLNLKLLEQFQNEFQEETTVFLGVMRDDSIAGYIILLEEAHAVQLKRIVIDENHLGSGKRTLELLVHYCLTELDRNIIWLDVYANNASAIHLYEKSGYVRYNEGMENCREVWFYRKLIRKNNGYT